MVANKINQIIEQGSDFHYQKTLFDSSNNILVVTGYSSNSEMRKSYFSNVAYPFNVSLANGVISLDMYANTTSNITPGFYVYDVYLFNRNDANNVTTQRIIEGQITVTPAVTHS